MISNHTDIKVNEDDLICPLTSEIFLDPVKVPVQSIEQSDGKNIEKYVTVEREFIEDWIKQKGTNPFVQEPLSRSDLKPDDEMKKAVAQFLASNTKKKKFQYVLKNPKVSQPSEQPLRILTEDEERKKREEALNAYHELDQRFQIRQQQQRQQSIQPSSLLYPCGDIYFSGVLFQPRFNTVHQDQQLKGWADT